MREAPEPRLCEAGHRGGLILPIFGEAEQEHWDMGLRTILYAAGLIWSFAGVAIIADIFMSAIETITSVKKRVRNKHTGRMVTVKVWNESVANLTLMALGSSAPEILLSFIELFQNEFMAGDLGPSTIVGSAAFNLFIIIAICVVSIPGTEVRAIKDTTVYCVTAVFSLFAYIWLIIILELISPNIVTVGEGVVTFLFFPVLVIIAYAADRGVFSPREEKVNRICAADLTKEELSEKAAEIRRAHDGNLSDEAVLEILQATTSEPKSRAQYRVGATRNMFGGKKVKGSASSLVVPAPECVAEDLSNKHIGILQFKCPHYAVLENVGTMQLDVIRTGNLDCTVSVDYKTRAGSAAEASDYIHVEGTLVFEPNDEEKAIFVKIVDDDAFEENEEFYVDLFSVAVKDRAANVQLGPYSVATVTIIDDDLPGILLWDEDFTEVTENVRDTEFSFLVERKCGSTGLVTCEWTVENASAVQPLDFEATPGVVEFQPGQLQATVTVLIKSRGRYEKTEEFRIILQKAKGGAKFDADTDGGQDCCIKTIRIVADARNREAVDKLGQKLVGNYDNYKLGSSNWKEQFTTAWYCNGSREEQQEASLGDWIFHITSLPWKLFFAFVPPTDYANGWVCFYVALMFIAVVTALIGDLAAFFGCTVGLHNAITAITFVALGTSLPDLFASKTAACQSETADASICNVTGSNSVNVFLGLGLPWSIAAIYWSAGGPTYKWDGKYRDFHSVRHLGPKEAAFVAESGDLVTSVIIFTLCALSCMAGLAVRRRAFGGELGGPILWRWITFAAFISLWFVYILMSILIVEKVI